MSGDENGANAGAFQPSTKTIAWLACESAEQSPPWDRMTFFSSLSITHMTKMPAAVDFVHKAIAVESVENSIFISDIGAHRLKPLFIVGGTITAIAYAGTIFAAHHARHDVRMYGIKDTKWKKGLSILALVAGVAACVGCICLTIFDTRRFTEIHRPMLSMTFLGIAISGVCTDVVYSGEMKRSTESQQLRK
ncbi:MAG: hypothetical protein Q9222_002252 [Ikaeria aurantiellina]